MALIGVGLVAALVLKLEASRPRYKKQKGAYSVLLGILDHAACVAQAGLLRPFARRR